VFLCSFWTGLQHLSPVETISQLMNGCPGTLTAEWRRKGGVTHSMFSRMHAPLVSISSSASAWPSPQIHFAHVDALISFPLLAWCAAEMSFLPSRALTSFPPHPSRPETLYQLACALCSSYDKSLQIKNTTT
jgi:hypothetical protein